jgi:hypothetical protein
MYKIASVVHYSLPSSVIRFPYGHAFILFFSPRYVRITHIARHLQYERAVVVCSLTDDSWRKCRLLDHGYNAVAVTHGPGSHVMPRTLHWLLTEDMGKVKKGQILLVHTYRTTSSRLRGRRVQSSVEIGSEMWICVRYKKGRNKQTNKNHFFFIYKIVNLNPFRSYAEPHPTV